MIFVTGGTGLLGNCIVRELCNRGHRVRVLCRSSTSREPFDDLDVEIVEGDLSSADLLKSAISGCHTTIHSAAYIHIGWKQMVQSCEVNVTGTERVVAACISNQSKLLYVSTVDTLPAARGLEEPIDENGENGVPKTACAYVVSKTKAEQYVTRMIAAGDLRAVVFHPGFMLGPHDWKPSSGRMFLEVYQSPIVAAPPGGCSFCDARDVAAAIANATDSSADGRHYILAGENLSYQDLWRRMLAVAGSKKRVFRLGPGLKLIAKASDILYSLLPIPEGDVNGASMAMGCLCHYYRSDRAETELGYRRRPPQETLHDAWNWLAEHHLRSTSHAG